VGGILAALLGALHEQLVDLEAPVLDLLLGLLGLAEDGSGLRVVVAVSALEEGLGVLVALVHHADDVGQRWPPLERFLQRREVGVEGGHAAALQDVDVEHALDVDVGLDAAVGLQRVADLRERALRTARC
jgi:hypothetical protein